MRLKHFTTIIRLFINDGLADIYSKELVYMGAQSCVEKDNYNGINTVFIPVIDACSTHIPEGYSYRCLFEVESSNDVKRVMISTDMRNNIKEIRMII